MKTVDIKSLQRLMKTFTNNRPYSAVFLIKEGNLYYTDGHILFSVTNQYTCEFPDGVYKVDTCQPTSQVKYPAIERVVPLSKQLHCPFDVEPMLNVAMVIKPATKSWVTIDPQGRINSKTERSFNLAYVQVALALNCTRAWDVDNLEMLVFSNDAETNKVYLVSIKS